MYLTANSVTLDSDELGFELCVEGDEGPLKPLVINIQGIDLDAFYDQVKARIGPYLREREEARRTLPTRFECDPDESGGYALDDPKHPTYHDRVVALYDDRDKFSVKV